MSKRVGVGAFPARGRRRQPEQRPPWLQGPPEGEAFEKAVCLHPQESCSTLLPQGPLSRWLMGAQRPPWTSGPRDRLPARPGVGVLSPVSHPPTPVAPRRTAVAQDPTPPAPLHLGSLPPQKALSARH